MDSAFFTQDQQSIIESVPCDAIFALAETPEEALIRDDTLSVHQSAE